MDMKFEGEIRHFNEVKKVDTGRTTVYNGDTQLAGIESLRQ